MENITKEMAITVVEKYAKQETSTVFPPIIHLHAPCTVESATKRIAQAQIMINTGEQILFLLSYHLNGSITN